MIQTKILIPFPQLLVISHYCFPRFSSIGAYLKSVIKAVESIEATFVSWFILHNIKKQFHTNWITLFLFIRNKSPEFIVMQTFLHGIPLKSDFMLFLIIYTIGVTGINTLVILLTLAEEKSFDKFCIGKADFANIQTSENTDTIFF